MSYSGAALGAPTRAAVSVPVVPDGAWLSLPVPDHEPPLAEMVTVNVAT